MQKACITAISSIIHFFGRRDYAPYSLRSTQNLKQRVGVELIELVASLDPEPVAKRYASAQSKGGEECNGVRRGEEENVNDKSQGGDRMEGEIGVER